MLKERIPLAEQLDWASAKEYRPPPPPKNSFLAEFAYRAQNTPAALIRSPVSTITETTPPPRNSEGPNCGNRNTVDREDRNGNKSRDNGHQTGFVNYMFDKSKGSDVVRNFKNIRVDFKVRGGQQRPSTFAEEAPKDTGIEKESFVLGARNLTIIKKVSP